MAKSKVNGTGKSTGLGRENSEQIIQEEIDAGFTKKRISGPSYLNIPQCRTEWDAMKG